jgi:RNA polymerase sigma-70 factor (ECF subfamily)
MEQQLTKESVRRGLKQLPDEYREILLLREIQGLSYEEISAALDLEVGTVKSRIYRGRKKLCDYLIKDGNIPDFTSSGKMRGGELP